MARGIPHGYCGTCKFLEPPDPARFPPTDRPYPPKCRADAMPNGRMLIPNRDPKCEIYQPASK